MVQDLHPNLAAKAIAHDKKKMAFKMSRTIMMMGWPDQSILNDAGTR